LFKFVGRCFSILFAIIAAAASAPAGITLEIHHLWEGNPCDLPSGELTTRAGEKIDLTRLAYLLSEPRLLRRGDNKASGDWLQRSDWFAYVDAGRGASKVSLSGLPPAIYTTSAIPGTA